MDICQTKIFESQMFMPDIGEVVNERRIGICSGPTDIVKRYKATRHRYEENTAKKEFFDFEWLGANSDNRFVRLLV